MIAVELITWLSGFGTAGMESLGKILELVKKIRATEDRAEELKLGIAILREMATLSPTSVDDDILSVIDKVASQELLDQMIKLVSRFRGGFSAQQSFTVQQLGDDTAVFTAQGLSILQLIAAAKMLSDLIKTLKSLKG